MVIQRAKSARERNVSEQPGKAVNKLELLSLTKQLRLMSNLFEQYFSEVPIEYWGNLLNVLRSQETALRNIIKCEKGPLKKKNREDALNSLVLTIEDYLCQNERKAA